MTDHCAPPRSPDGGIGVPRNEDGIYRPETWEQAYGLILAMVTGAVPAETTFDLSALPPLTPIDEIVAVQPMTAPLPPECEGWFKWVDADGVEHDECPFAGKEKAPMTETEECKHERQTKKRYPHMARCKDCGKSICPDCDGTKVGAWGRCATCKGTGTIEEEKPT